jgi:hypothetical protein
MTANAQKSPAANASREQALGELGHLASRDENLSYSEFRHALNLAASVFPGSIEEFRAEVGGLFGNPPTTVRRWQEGRILPPIGMRSKIIARIRKLLIETLESDPD